MKSSLKQYSTDRLIPIKWQIISIDYVVVKHWELLEVRRSLKNVQFALRVEALEKLS